MPFSPRHKNGSLEPNKADLQILADLGIKPKYKFPPLGEDPARFHSPHLGPLTETPKWNTNNRVGHKPRIDLRNRLVQRQPRGALDGITDQKLTKVDGQGISEKVYEERER